MNQLPTPQVPLPTPKQETLAAVPVGEAREVFLSKLVSDVYGESAPSLRAKLLECLLKPVRPLALVSIAAGAFGGFLHRAHWSRFSVSIDDAVQFSTEQVFELARFAEQVQPEVFRQVAAVVAENPVCLKTLSGSLLLMALRLWMPSQPSSSSDNP